MTAVPNRAVTVEPLRPSWPPGDHRDDPLDRVALVASAEPAVVLASLAEQCIPAVCDSCVVDIDDDGATYRLARPMAPPSGLDRAQHRAEDAHTVRVPIEDPAGAGYRGVATFTWHRRPPTPGEQVLARLLVEHALRTVAWQRSEQAARVAAAQAAHLTAALEASRRIGAAIGILMSLHKIPEGDAFEALRVASQNSNRKLREIAFDVVDTGWLDPALLRAAPPLT